MKPKELLTEEYAKVNMTPVFEGGGFFYRRDTTAVEAIRRASREAFFAGFSRSDQPPPSAAKIEAAFEAWCND